MPSSASSRIYTLALWTARPGCGESFISTWEAFALWTAQNCPGAGRAYLLQDSAHPDQFISFGPWESDDAVKSWRGSAEFKEFVLKIRELCSDFQPRSLLTVACSE
jgi:heme-degrading monooxygenase HmoA